MMIPMMILFGEITAVVCTVGAIIFSVLLFSDWDKKEEHSGHSHDSEHGH